MLAGDARELDVPSSAHASTAVDQEREDDMAAREARGIRIGLEVGEGPLHRHDGASGGQADGDEDHAGEGHEHEADDAGRFVERSAADEQRGEGGTDDEVVPHELDGDPGGEEAPQEDDGRVLARRQGVEGVQHPEAAEHEEDPAHGNSVSPGV